MSKQSSIYFLILVILAAVGGFFVNRQIQKTATSDILGSINPVSVSTKKIDTKEGTDVSTGKKLEEKVQNKKIMNDSDVTKLDIQVTKQGTGTVLSKKGDRLFMNYTGRLLNGTVFDSNVDPKFNHVQPFDFVVGAGMVIAGWDQGLLDMKVGEKRTLTIPATMGYGSRGAGALIPPNAALMFEVELLKIN